VTDTNTVDGGVGTVSSTGTQQRIISATTAHAVVGEVEVSIVLVIDTGVQSVDLGALGEVVAVTQSPLAGISLVIGGQQVATSLTSVLIGNRELVGAQDVLHTQEIGVTVEVQRTATSDVEVTLEVLVHANQGGALAEVIGSGQQVGLMIFFAERSRITDRTIVVNGAHTQVVQLQVGISQLQATVGVIQGQVPTVGVSGAGVGSGGINRLRGIRDVSDHAGEAVEGGRRVGDGIGTEDQIHTTQSLTEYAVGSTRPCGPGNHVKAGHDGAVGSGNITTQHGTEVAGQSHEGIALATEQTRGLVGAAISRVDGVTGRGSGGVGQVNGGFELEQGLQAVAQIFATLETDQRRVGGNTGAATDVGVIDSGVSSVVSLHGFERSVSNAVDGDVGLGEGTGGGQAGNSQGDQFLLH